MNQDDMEQMETRALQEAGLEVPDDPELRRKAFLDLIRSKLVNYAHKQSEAYNAGAEMALEMYKSLYKIK